MKKNYLLVYLIIGLLFLSCGSNKLPQEAKNLLINNLEFSKPIYLMVPHADSRSHYEDIVNNPTVISQTYIPKLLLAVNEEKPLNEYNKSVVSFLKKNKYLEIKRAEQTTVSGLGNETKKYTFSLYTTTGQNFLESSNSNNAFRYDKMKAGLRKFKSIDSESSFDEEIQGTKRKIHSLIFSYTIDPLLTGLDSIKNQIFSGEAQIYKSNEEWVVKSVAFHDSGSDELLKIIEQNYGATNDEKNCIAEEGGYKISVGNYNHFNKNVTYAVYFQDNFTFSIDEIGHYEFTVQDINDLEFRKQIIISVGERWDIKITYMSNQGESSLEDIPAGCYLFTPTFTPKEDVSILIKNDD